MKNCHSPFFAVITVPLFVLCMQFFLSCASTKNEIGADISPVYITNTKKFYLLSPDNIEKPVDSLQLLTGSFGDSSFVLQAFLQADANGFFLSLLNDFGTGMGNLVYDGTKITFDSAVFPKSLKPEYIASDLQFAYYKPSAIKKSLSELNLDFTLTNEDGKEIRRIMNGTKCIEQISKSDGVVDIENFLRGYRYNLQEAAE